jgi:hypothetical protein
MTYDGDERHRADEDAQSRNRGLHQPTAPLVTADLGADPSRQILPRRHFLASATQLRCQVPFEVIHRRLPRARGAGREGHEPSGT